LVSEPPVRGSKCQVIYPGNGDAEVSLDRDQ
jgi:hypothetical protein